MHRQSNMTCLRIAALLGLAMLLLSAAVPAAYAQNTVGTITQLQGVADIQRNGATTPAAVNEPVMLHDKIVTEANASLTISMVDNSSLQLGASSTLTIDESMLVSGVGAPRKVGLLGGSLHSTLLGAMRGSSTMFEVNTPNAIGAVRGTDWTQTFKDQPQSQYKGCLQFTDVDVNEGTVQVCNKEGPLHCTKECRDVTAGHHITVACCGFFLANTGGLGVLGPIGATALGVGLAGGIGVGAAAGAGAFNTSAPPVPPLPVTGSR